MREIIETITDYRQSAPYVLIGIGILFIGYQIFFWTKATDKTIAKITNYWTGRTFKIKKNQIGWYYAKSWGYESKPYKYMEELIEHIEKRNVEE